jgi:hypothetical protein
VLAFFTGASYYTKHKQQYGIDLNDPQSGSSLLHHLNVTVSGTIPGTTPGNLLYVTNQVCNGEQSTSTGANLRNYALLVQLEGGSVYCLDNH